MFACVKTIRPLFRPAFELVALAAFLAGLAALVNAHWRPVAVASALVEDRSAYVLSLAEIRAAPRFQEALWLDARNSADFALSHVPGALRFTEAEWETHLPELLDRWEPGVPVVVYCDSPGCGTAARIAARLRQELADKNIYALEGGWPAWRPVQ
jgi:rhodanese-related sulfurtransferase